MSQERSTTESSRLSRRVALLTGAAFGATSVGLAVGGTAAGGAAAQDASPSPITEIPGAVGTLFSVVAADLPPPPVEVTLARVVSQPGDGDLEDFFIFPGPLAFVLESGAEVCRCGTVESPCLLLHVDGTSEPAPPSPADIPLGPGEGLYIPANTPDSFFIPGDEPAVELDLSIFPAQAAPGTPEATPAN
jgi:hypothetical protein